MNLAGLGALAGGLNAGLVQGQNRLDTLAERDRVATRQKRLDDRQDQQWAREDEDRATLEAANAAGQSVMKKYADEWKKQQPGPTLDGSPVAVNQFNPTPAMMLEAGRARTDKLLELKGPSEAWMKSWVNDEAMRTNVRAQAGQRVKAAMLSGADLTEPLGEFFGTINDGYTVTGVKPIRGVDGKTTLQVQRVNRYSGQEVDPMMIPAETLQSDIDRLSVGGADLAKHSLAMNLEAFKQAGRLKEIGARADAEQGTAKAKHVLTLEEIDARNSGAKEVAGIRAAGAGKSKQAEEIKALGQERTSVDNEIRTLVQQLKDARPTDRPGIQSDLAAARERAADVRRRLAAISSDSPDDAAAPQSDPGTAVMEAATRDAQKQGLDSFTVESKPVNGGRPTTVKLKKDGAAQAPAPAASANGVAKPTSKAEYDALPSGALYERDGKVYRKK